MRINPTFYERFERHINRPGSGTRHTMTTSDIQFLKNTLKVKVAECTALREQIRVAEEKAAAKPKPAAKPSSPARQAGTKK